MKKRIELLRELSIPMLAGVVAALVWANVAYDEYLAFISTPMFRSFDLQFIVIEIFMALFFGIAAIEITQGCLPGGDLNPPRKALNPLLATMGGVIGPVVFYLALNAFIGAPALNRGWGIPTATDIALAWLAARVIFGAGHPVIAFLLLLAIADDAIGLLIIALFYPDPSYPVEPVWLALTAVGMIMAWLLRRRRTRSYWPYLLLGGLPSWLGLHYAHLHPALALVPIVPFLPHGRHEHTHIFVEDLHDSSAMARFEHEWKVVVDFGLFFFGLVNAGVRLATVDTITWLVLAALVAGKGFGILGFGLLGIRLGFPLPKGMDWRHLLVAGIIAGTGFTVALFVAGAAFADPALRGAARMGAIMSVSAIPLAWLLARLLGVGRKT